MLRENVVSLGYEDKCTVRVGDYRRVVETLRHEDRMFDLLFLDPPYRMLAEVEATLASAVPALLSRGGIVVVEGPRRGVSRIWTHTQYSSVRTEILRSRWSDLRSDV